MRFTIIIAAILPLLAASLPTALNEETNFNALESRNPGNLLSGGGKKLKPVCDSGADKTCTQGKPCKAGHYNYDGNHPYQAVATACLRICSCQ